MNRAVETRLTFPSTGGKWARRLKEEEEEGEEETGAETSLDRETRRAYAPIVIPRARDAQLAAKGTGATSRRT